MVRFSVAPVAEVAPKPRRRGPSRRSLTREQYRQALEQALADGEALVVEMEPDEKPLTVRQRVVRAAKALGAEDVRIRRRGNRIIAYQDESVDGTTSE